MNKENIAKSAIGVTIVMIIGYFLSFGKEALVAYYFGGRLLCSCNLVLNKPSGGI